MPIEIRELVIRAYIEPDNNARSGNNSAASNKEANTTAIAESIEQVMEMIKDKKER